MFVEQALLRKLCDSGGFDTIGLLNKQSKKHAFAGGLPFALLIIECGKMSRPGEFSD